MKTRAILVMTLATAGVCFGQAVKPASEPEKPVVEAVPQLSVTETTAIGAILQQYQNIQGQFQAVAADIARTHPGYHLDVSGGPKLVKDAAPAPPAAAAPPAKAAAAP